MPDGGPVFQGVDQDFAEAMRLLSRSINAQRPSWAALTLVDLPPTKVRGAEVQAKGGRGGFYANKYSVSNHCALENRVG